MTPEEYITKNKYKPLSDTERNKGKTDVKIYGTQDPMPWDDVYTRIAAGMSLEHIAERYGNGRKIALWAVEDNIKYVEDISELLDSEILQRRKMQEVDKVNPTAAVTIHEMANEYAPDVAQKVAMFAGSLVTKSQEILNRKEATSIDMLNLAKAVQSVTDTLGLTQRHASAGGNTVNQIAVSGFAFVQDLPPEDVTEATIVDDEDVTQ